MERESTTREFSELQDGQCTVSDFTPVMNVAALRA